MAMYNKKEKIKKHCLFCNSIFFVLPSRNKRKFCLMKCSNSYQLGKKKHGNYKPNSGSFKAGGISHNKGKKTPQYVIEKMRNAKLKNPTRYWLGKDRIDLRKKRRR